MTEPVPAERWGGRIVWHGAARELARALRETGTASSRLYVFDIPPRLMRGLYAAAFAGADGKVHRFLGPYFDPTALREAVEPLDREVRRQGLAVVDGRLEVGANTGDLLHFFLANLDEAQGPERMRERGTRSLEAWQGAVLDLRGCAVRLRSVSAPGPGRVLAASAGREHLLIRVEEGGTALSGILARLGPRVGGRIGDIRAGGALHRDIMGEWAGTRWRA